MVPVDPWIFIRHLRDGNIWLSPCGIVQVYQPQMRWFNAKNDGVSVSFGTPSLTHTDPHTYGWSSNADVNPTMVGCWFLRFSFL